jgi:hypothetical protein
MQINPQLCHSSQKSLTPIHEQDLRKMEQKLQCGAAKVDAPVVEPAAPITRHRRDVDAADDAPSPSPVAIASTTSSALMTTSAPPSPTTATTTPAPSTAAAATQPSTDPTSTEETTSEAAPMMSSATTPPPSARMNVEIIAHIYDTSTDGAMSISRVVTVQDTRTTEEQQQTTTAEHGQQEVKFELMPNSLLN